MDDRDLDKAVKAAECATQRADARTRDADARLHSADARIADADAQVRHSEAHMAAAIAHMQAAEAHMFDADQRVQDADTLMDKADEELADAAARLAEARDDSDEYQRAVFHYTQLVRHRMANPLQTVCGVLSTLKDRPDLPASERAALVDAAYEQAQALTRICLDPVPTGGSERELEPRPFA